MQQLEKALYPENICPNLAECPESTNVSSQASNLTTQSRWSHTGTAKIEDQRLVVGWHRNQVRGMAGKHTIPKTAAWFTGFENAGFKRASHGLYSNAG
jgi:hypothetical protein